jgi:Polyketide cyclase / dehydrase and lipid transport
MANYHFITHWQVEATCAKVYDVLKGANELPRWWPAVYLDIKTLEAGEPSGLGRVIELYTKGYLPYTLRWKSKVTEVSPIEKTGFALEAFGDLKGRGVWHFKQNGNLCDITYDWKIDAEKPLLKYLSFIMKPLFSSNHHWAMNKGLESLKLELLRRQKGLPAHIRPPQPTFPHNFLNNKIL